MKTTKWWFITTIIFKCGLPVSFFFWLMLNFNSKLVEEALSWPHHETAKWICAKLLWNMNMAVWSSSYLTISLRYGVIARCELKPGIGTQKVMASSGVFVRIVYSLKRFLAAFLKHQALFWPEQSINKATATERWAQRKIFTRGGNALNKQNANREKW
jgi:hypothetical protein